ncbi:Fcj1p [Malassezia vespertilionis]|uniref:MICOS complex subunit MIC60 n=1 Tax=Malassezia vespertilionis TaxID=2020962 RepID=A0A2N1J7W3_9BASI|nr:Fcj1p [Malassezia vespertilionis]
MMLRPRVHPGTLYTTDAPIPAKKGGFVSGVIKYTVLGALVVYGGGVLGARYNTDFRIAFEEHVPGGKMLLDFIEHPDLRKDLQKLDMDEAVAKAANQVRARFSDLSSKVMQNSHVRQSRADIEKSAAELHSKVMTQLEDLKKDAKLEGQDKMKELANIDWQQRASDLAEKSIDQVREQAVAAAAKVGEALPKNVRDALPLPAPASQEPVYEAMLPVGFEAPVGYKPPTRERKLVAPDPNNDDARLRADPTAPKLPQLVPALSKLSVSEPVVKQLAGTIDELAVFLRDTPNAGANAKTVLESAKIDLEQLLSRMDQIKRTDAKKLDLKLEKQAKEFEAVIAKHAEKAAGELGKRDKDWQTKLDKVQDEETALFKGRLAKELEAQSAIINERLRQEVMAQGVELQRKWAKQIHAKVEEERAGRLAHLDALASELDSIESLSEANAKSLEETIHLNTATASLRALRAAIDGDAPSAEPNAYVRHTFSKQLDRLRRTELAKKDALVGAAVTAVDATNAANDGVESPATLHEWFVLGLAPSLRKVALLPEQGAGIVAYLVSSTLSPLLFARKGLVPGDDVASTVARAEWYLDHNDLDSATRELNQLRGWSKVLAGDWLGAARKRLEVDQAMDLIDMQTAFATLLKT